MTRRAPFVALAVAVVGLLIAGVVAAVSVDDDDDGVVVGRPGVTTTASSTTAAPASTTTTVPATTTTTAPPATTTTTAAPVDELEAAVGELSAYVADQRELEFLRPVDVELLDDAAFETRLLEDDEDDEEDDEVDERVLRALHLIEPDVDLSDTFESFLSDAVLGFYDPEADQLVVRGAALTPYVRVTLVHELVHALDDQHFELDRPDLDDADGEEGTGFRALLEGNAVRVEEAYREGLDDQEQDAIAAEEASFGQGIDVTAVPPILSALLGFPYAAGPSLVAAIVVDGGERAVDRSFSEPPTTSEQVIDPAAYLAGEGRQAVPAPPADGEVVDEGAYGQLALALTLDEVLDVQTAREAAFGWGGDAYVAWDEGERTCVRVVFAMDTPRDLVELGDALAEWAEAHGSATVEPAGDQVTLTACG